MTANQSLPSNMSRGQKAAATRKANQAREAIRLLAEQTAEQVKHVIEEDVATLTTSELIQKEKEIQDKIEQFRDSILEPDIAEEVKVIIDDKYHGPMLALRERAKRGVYTRALNGQPSCGDEIAKILGALKPEQVIRVCLVALNYNVNPYAHLNNGQQSMNLRNKLRGAIKKGEFGMGVVYEAIEEILEIK